MLSAKVKSYKYPESCPFLPSPTFPFIPITPCLSLTHSSAPSVLFSHCWLCFHLFHEKCISSAAKKIYVYIYITVALFEHIVSVHLPIRLEWAGGRSYLTCICCFITVPHWAITGCFNPTDVDRGKQIWVCVHVCVKGILKVFTSFEMFQILSQYNCKVNVF